MVIKMMKEMMEKGYIRSMMFITHELPLLYNVTDDIAVMYAGQFVEYGTAKEMVFDPLHPYSHGLMGSILVPEEGTRGMNLTAIPGTPPNLKRPPAGCRFAERCKYATPECFYTAPAEKMFGENSTRMYRCLMSEEALRAKYAEEGGASK
jgi:peptide/nickel transport system ATP-binding protein